MKGQVLEQPVHEALEGLGGVAQSERHEKVLEQAKRGYNHRFCYVIEVPSLSDGNPSRGGCRRNSCRMAAMTRLSCGPCAVVTTKASQNGG